MEALCFLLMVIVLPSVAAYEPPVVTCEEGPIELTSSGPVTIDFDEFASVFVPDGTSVTTQVDPSSVNIGTTVVNFIATEAYGISDSCEIVFIVDPPSDSDSDSDSDSSDST